MDAADLSCCCCQTRVCMHTVLPRAALLLFHFMTLLVPLAACHRTLPLDTCSGTCSQIWVCSQTLIALSARGSQMRSSTTTLDFRWAHDMGLQRERPMRMATRLVVAAG